MLNNGQNAFSPLSTTQLDSAYRATSYLLHLRSDTVRLRVDQPSTEFNAFLERAQCAEWAFICAVNPGSELLTEAANANRHRKLLANVSAQKRVYFSGDAIPDKAGWPIEPGLLLLHIGVEQALELAREFGQTAILAGQRNDVPRLYYCNEINNMELLSWA